MPHSWTLPATSACCACTMPTSGRSARTAASRSPVNGQSISCTEGVRPTRSVPAYPRRTPNGRPDAPAAYAAAIPACECSSSSSGAGQLRSTASRKRCSEPTPGFPPHENVSLRAQPAPIIWSYTRSGVIRTSVRSRRPRRISSCPAAWGIRWVNPSSATTSPSRTSSSIASRSGTTTAMVRRGTGASRSAW